MVEGQEIKISNTRLEIRQIRYLLLLLSKIHFDEKACAHYDRIADHAKNCQLGFIQASENLSESISYRDLAILLFGYFHSWHEGGSDAALTLPEVDQLADKMTQSGETEYELVLGCAEIARMMAQVNLYGDPHVWRKIGKLLLESIETALTLDRLDTNLCADLALVSHDILTLYDDDQAKVAQVMAYRLLLWSKKQPFLADIAPRKYPPPFVPARPSETNFDIALNFIQHVIQNEDINLQAISLDMLEDDQSVLCNQLTFSIDGNDTTLRIEIVFGRNLLSWVHSHNERDAAVSAADPDTRIRVMLQLLVRNRILMERKIDTDLNDIYIMPYIGTRPLPEDRIELAMKIECIDNIVRCVIGLGEDDVLASDTGRLVFPLYSDELLSRFKSIL